MKHHTAEAGGIFHFHGIGIDSTQLRNRFRHFYQSAKED
jgi:hypothetical protein